MRLRLADVHARCGTMLFTALGGLMTATAGAILTMKSYCRRREKHNTKRRSRGKPAPVI